MRETAADARAAAAEAAAWWLFFHSPLSHSQRPSKVHRGAPPSKSWLGRRIDRSALFSKEHWCVDFGVPGSMLTRANRLQGAGIGRPAGVPAPDCAGARTFRRSTAVARSQPFIIFRRLSPQYRCCVGVPCPHPSPTAPRSRRLVLVVCAAQCVSLRCCPGGVSLFTTSLPGAGAGCRL